MDNMIFDPNNWGILKTRGERFVIIDTSNTAVIDDAQGHGFSSYKSAYNYGFNKFHCKGKCNDFPNVDQSGSQPLF